MFRHSPGRSRSWRRAGIAAIAAALVTTMAGPVAAKKNSAPAVRNGSVYSALRKSADTASAVNDGSMYAVVDQIGARDLWEDGITGDGVNVAVIDTGVTPVPALSDPEKIIAVADFSGEARVDEARYFDTYGHGTHMIGIIAGHEPGADPALAEDHPEWFLGVAPDAGIVSVKVADNSGAVDITQVIAGVDWVVEHAEQLDIGVLNLSYSSGSAHPYEVDPLTQALERAWDAGIVVVVAAGNDGKGERVLASPAIDPYVIAVAGAKHHKKNKFKVPKWSTSGDGVRNPDVAAPAVSIESLRVPGSRVDVEHPEGYVDERLFKGTGTSQAAAVVSGAAALLLEARPELSPDQVKALLQTDTSRISPSAARFSGAGVINLRNLIDLPAPDAVQDHQRSDGTGSLEGARNGQHVTVDGTVIEGEITVLGNAWDGASWAGTTWTGGSWDGASWVGASWMGTTWTGASWAGASWAGASWAGTTWTGASWADESWSGATWTGASWAGASWAGASWAGASWAGASWAGASWAGASWL